MNTLARVSGACPKFEDVCGRSAPRRFRWLPFQIISILLAVLIAFPALGADKRDKKDKKKDVEKIGSRDINRGSMNFYSVEKEIALGLEISKQIEATAIILRDPEVQGYVNDVVQRLVRHSDAYAPFSVKIVDSDEINAFALPGGFLYVNTGLILQAHTEAELAGMLAHEIAHVTARHYTKQQSKATLLKWLSIPLMILGGPAGAALYQGLGITGPLALLKFARNHEREADMLGIQYAYKSGYDPTGLVDILERLGEREEREASSSVFSSHPMKRNRIQRAQEEIGAVLPERDSYVISTGAFDRIRARLNRRYMNRNLYEPDAQDGPTMRRRTQDYVQ